MYKNVSRFYVRRRISKTINNKFKWALNLNVGDLVNDCSLFNHKIISVKPIYANYRNGWYMCDIDFVLEDMICSLVSCGIRPAKSRIECEKQYLIFLNDWLNSGRAKKYYSNDKEIKRLEEVRKIILEGGHVCNENGIPTTLVHL